MLAGFLSLTWAGAGISQEAREIFIAAKFPINVCCSKSSNN